MDLLVKLYDLPEHQNHNNMKNIIIRKPIPPEKSIFFHWVAENFNQSWADECEICFYNKPVSCWVAQENDAIIGFACYESTFKNFFGPFGVHPDYRGYHIGKELMFRSLVSMRELGYAYAIIGGAGPVSYYEKFLPVMKINHSIPGIYRDMIPQIK